VTLIAGTPIRRASLSSGLVPLQFLDAATVQVDILVNADGTISARRGASTVLGTSDSQFIFEDTNHYIEATVTIHDTAGTVDVHVDGMTALSLTNQNTRQSANATVDAVRFGCSVDGDDTYLAVPARSLRRTS
jgi:hypothetical protein